MAKGLFFGLPLHGHTNPSLPLVRALADRGEEIVYVSSDTFAENIRQAGARYRPYAHPFLQNPGRLSEHTDRLAWLLMRTTGEVLECELDTYRAERPDYIISDSVAPWGQWIGQILDVPVVTSVTTFALNRHVLAFAAAHGARPKSVALAWSKIRHAARAAVLGRRLRRRYGVGGTGIFALMFGSSVLNIVYTSREFQPCAESFDSRYLFVGPSVEAREHTSAAPVVGAGGNQIFVSLGTLFNSDLSFYRACFQALGGQSRQVVMSIGDNVTPDSLGPPPTNIVVERWVPQLEMLRHAAVFVSHGGMNSVSESLHYGVPLVVVPQMGEQEIVGRQVERLGAGLYMAKHEVSAERLQRAVDRVLAEPGFRQAALALSDSFARAGGAGRAAEAILSLTRPKPAPA